jgi:hypothetical protein
MKVLQELACQPLSDAAFAQAVRALVRQDDEPRREPTSEAPTSSLTALRRRARQKPSARPARQGAEFKRIPVRDAEGNRTTVGLAAEFFVRASQRLGGPRKVTALARQLSRQLAPGDRNRSKWVREGIEARLATPAQDTRTRDLFGGVVRGDSV